MSPTVTKIIIRSADLDRDRNLLIDAITRNLDPAFNTDLFDWRYRKNPHGTAKAWIAYDESGNSFVGMAASFPRRMYLGNDEISAWVLGDFCIEKTYRSLGPAVQLQKACLLECATGLGAYFYDFPCAEMMAVYRRLGFRSNGSLVRMTRLIRADRLVHQFVGNPVVVNLIGRILNPILTLAIPKIRIPHNIVLEYQTEDCPADFSSLSQHVGSTSGACVQRSAEYLNWRYFAHPSRQYEMLTARRSGHLIAYVVFTEHRRDGMVVDWFGVEDSTILSLLVKKAIKILCSRGAVTISIPLMGPRSRFDLLRSQMFHSREKSPVVTNLPLYTGPANAETNIFLMTGDRDT